MTEDSGPSATPAESCSKTEHHSDSLSSQRVFKKSSPNNKLTMYLSSRDLVVSAGRIDRLSGVLLVDPEFVDQRKVYGQITLTFRYGREDEEVMGLKFCNEAVMCLAQLYPPHPGAQTLEGNTALQDALLKRLGPNAYPFSMEVTPLAPPSVQLVPAKEYNGAPIGTSYDVRAYVADRADEKLHRRTTVRMGIRVVQRAFAPPSPYLYSPGAGIGSKSTKERNKHKKALFGCRSEPLEVRFQKESKDKQYNTSRSVEAVGLQQNKLPECLDDNNKSAEGQISPSRLLQVPDESEGGCRDKSEGLSDGDMSPHTHVSFKEHMSNGIGDEIVDQSADETNRIEGKDDKTNETDQICSDNECSLSSDQIRSTCGGKRPSLAAYLAEVPPPQSTVEKPFLLSDGRIYLSASLDKAIYAHGEEIQVSVQIKNSSNKTIRRIKVFVVQHVDVCMFSNGKFKNVVAIINTKDECPITSGCSLDKTYTLLPIKSSTKNWIALEDSYTKAGTSLASTVTCTGNTPEERNVFAIYVSYYVKVKLLVSVMGGEVSLKLPFTLMHTCSEFEPLSPSPRVSEPPRVHLELKSTQDDIKPEKDGT